MKAIQLKPIRTESLKDVFVSRFEELILSGQISIGEKLLPERELALKLGVSRPVVHEGIIDLAAKGLVTLKPRVGTVVNDFRKQGSLALLSSLTKYHEGKIEPKFLDSLLDIRRLFELETTRLAAKNRTKEQTSDLKEIIRQESVCDQKDIKAVVDLDFRFHHLVSLATGNLVYPLLINSFKQVYTNLTGQFFLEDAVIPFVFNLHKSLAEAIEKGDEEAAALIMGQLLDHGEEYLNRFVKETNASAKVSSRR